MATPDDVERELVNNNDLVTVYDGAQGMFPEGGRRTGSLRYAVFKLVWDLMRFQSPATNIKPPFDMKAKWGMRDMVSAVFLRTEQNNFMLRKLCEAQGVSLTGMPGE